MAYIGGDAKLYDLLFNFKHSIVLQSLHSTEGNEATNGDGFGVGWYPPDGEDDDDDDDDYDEENKEEKEGGDESYAPLLFRSVEPAWHDKNLKEIARAIESPVVFCHVRAASPGVSTVQQTNCHPFRHGRWLFMHNGAIRGFGIIKRDLQMRVDPELYPCIEGSTDSETFFYLCLSFGLRQDPPTAVAKAVGLITQLGKEKADVEFPIQMTVATTDGDRLWAFRYSSEGNSRTLYYSSSLDDIMALYEENTKARKRMSSINTKKMSVRLSVRSLQHLQSFSRDARLVVSEPLGSEMVWNKVPESTCVFIEDGKVSLTDFAPIFEEKKGWFG